MGKNFQYKYKLGINNKSVPATLLRLLVATYVLENFPFVPDRKYYEELPLEKKRAEYVCGKDYVTLETIPTWEVFQKGSEFAHSNFVIITSHQDTALNISPLSSNSNVRLGACGL